MTLSSALLMTLISSPALSAENSGNDSATSCSCICADPLTTDTASTADTVEIPADPPAGETNVSAVTTASPQSRDAAPAAIVFSELLPDPVGKDTDEEFIELRNENAISVSLEGWSIVSNAGKIFTLPALIVDGGGYVLFNYAETKIVLANSGTSLTLFDGTGSKVAGIGYAETAKEGLSYAKNDAGTWTWTTAVTPGSANVFPSPEPETAPVPETGDATSVSAPDTASGQPADIIPENAAPSNVDVLAADDGPSFSSAAIGISEFLPNPAGVDDGEWIEIKNDGDGDISLAGWIIDDADGGSRPFTLTNTDVVPSHGWLLLTKSRTGLALNNDGDSVRLFDSDGRVLEAVRYDNATEGRSFAKTSAGFGWSDAPTPGTENTKEIMLNMAKIPDDTGSNPTASSEPQDLPTDEDDTIPNATIVDITELSEIDDGAVVTVRGVINIPGGRIGKTLIGLQNEAGTAGVIARYYGTDLPTTRLGELWTVRGKVRRDGNDIRINASARDATLLGLRELTAAPLTVADITDADAGIYARISGLVTKLGRDALTISDEDGSGEIRISLPQGRGSGSLAKGDPITAVGTLRYVRGKPELVVTDRTGINKETAMAPIGLNGGSGETENTEALVTPQVLTTMEKPPNYAAYGSVAALAAALWLAVIWWNKKRYTEAAQLN